jgi:TonB-linked SusC/RagA family outer membrane protein
MKNKRISCTIILLLTVVLAYGQNTEVSGKVTDAQGEALLGVSVLQQGTTNGTVTDINGNYRISVPPDAFIRFSYIGYLMQEVRVNKRSQIDIQMEENLESLDEIVVVGYGVQRKSDLTGAISSVKSEDIQSRSITRAEQALQGKAAGVQLITTSAQPGASPSIRVRGYSSNGASDPLYVVDGLRIADISSIDPNSIASIEVLKDAASAAIYGAEAGNGVVLITTKTGKSGLSSVSYAYQFVYNQMARRPRLITSEDAILMSKEASPTFTDADVQNLITTGVWDGKSTTDWYEATFEGSPTHRHTVNFEAGNEKGSFYLSLNMLNDDGILKGNKDYYKRLSPMLNADYNIKPWLKIGTTNTFEKWERQSIADGGSQTGNPNVYSSLIAKVMIFSPYWADTYPADALPTSMQNLMDAGWTLLTDANGRYYSALGGGDLVHPLVTRDATDNKNYGTNLLGTLFADFKPFKGFVLTSKLGYRIANADSYTYNNDYYGATSVSNKLNSASRTHSSTLYYQWENFVNYATQFADKHDVTLMAGTAYSENELTYVSASVDKVMKDDPLFADVSYPAGDANKSAAGYNTVNRKLSYFARAGYNFGNKYMLQASMRADAADLSVLPKEGRWGYFPAISAGWTLSNEDFFPKQNVLDFAKLRFSWGQNGSTSNLGGYMYSSAISNNSVGYSYFARDFIYYIASRPAQLSNPKLKWETSEQLDFGIDLRLFNNRLSVTFDWFDKKTKDLIVTGSGVPFEAGNTAPPINAGNVSNKGVELELGWRGSLGDLSYSVNTNASYLKNEVTYLAPSISEGRIVGGAGITSGGGVSAFEVGKPVWYFWGYKVDRLDGEGNPVFVDVDGNGMFDNQDRMEIGKPMPDVTYGLTFNASWKGLDLSIFGSGASGNSILSALGWGTITYNIKEIFDQRWTAANPNAKYAKPGCLSGDIYRYSDAYVFDGSYFKIKQIQMGYTLPKAWTKKIQVEQLRLYASLDDWFILTPYPGLDPEVSANSSSGMGVDYGNYPNTRKTVIGISVTF